MDTHEDAARSGAATIDGAACFSFMSVATQGEARLDLDRHPDDVQQALRRWATEFRQRIAARAFHTNSVVFHTLRCGQCGQTADLREAWPFAPSDGNPARVQERVCARAAARADKACPSCAHREMYRDGHTHAVISHAYARRSLVVYIVTMSYTADGVQRSDVEVLEIFRDDSVRRVEDPSGLAAELHDEYSVRDYMQTRLLKPVEAIRNAFSQHPKRQQIALREYGKRWEAQAEYSAAFASYDASLQFDDKDTDVLIATARILERALEYTEASQRMHRAWLADESPSTLDHLIRLAYRARRLGLLQGAATTLLEHDPESVTGYLGLICSMGVGKIVPLRRGFRDLAAAAVAAGNSQVEAVAQTWLRRLALPLPDWDEQAGHEAYLQQLEDQLDEAGFEIDTAPTSFMLDGVHVSFDLLATSDSGSRYVFFLVEGNVRSHVVRRLRGQLRALFSDDDWQDIEPIILTRDALPWYVYRMASFSPDARLELLASADTTMHVLDENVATFMWAAENYIGASLDFSLDSVSDVDRMIERWHEHGFGEISHSMAVLVASYLGEVLKKYGHGRWVDTDDGPDARAWQLNEDTQIFLIAHVRQCVALGHGESIQAFITRLIRGDDREHA